MTESLVEKKVQRALDILEIQNVMSKHEYYLSTMKHKEEWDDIWAHKVPDVSFTENWGTWVGTKNVYKGYVENMYEDEKDKKEIELRSKMFPGIQKVRKVGWFIEHTLTTPIIEVAGDGKTAKGWWYSVGAITGPIDLLGAYWVWERYACDFIKEDGKWKIWHFCVYCDFTTPFERNWVDNSLHPRPPEEGPAHGLNSDLPGSFEEYSPTRIPPDYPKPPEPYETFSETFSYGP